MEFALNCSFAVGILVSAFFLLIAGARLWDRFTNPVVLNAYKIAWEIRTLRFLAKRLPEGKLLIIRDREVMEMGESLLLEGELSTREINEAMLKRLEERLSSDLASDGYFPKNPVAVSFPGYGQDGKEKERDKLPEL